MYKDLDMYQPRLQSNPPFSLTIRTFLYWGWTLLSGILGILVAVILWASIPVTVIWLLGIILGIQLISEGAALGYLGWDVRKN
jgi:uncharacterized membrane protein HdeD (DUF308 family)